MTEAAVIAATMVVILASMWYAFDVHARKVKIMEETRSQVWPPVLRSCEGVATQGGGGGFIEDVNGQAGQSDSDTVGVSESDEYVNATGKIPQDEGYYEHVTTGKVPKGFLPVHPVQNQEARMYVRCNEKPKPGGLLDIILEAGKSAKDAIFSKFT